VRQVGHLLKLKKKSMKIFT